MDLSRRRFSAALLGTTTLSLVGCSGNGESDDQPQVRLLNASTGYSALDLYVDGTKEQSSIAYGAVGGYATVDEGSLSVVLKNAGSSSALNTANRSFSSGDHATILAYGQAGALSSLLLAEDEDDADSGETSLLIEHLATEAGTVDVFLLSGSDTLDDAVALASSLAAGSSYGRTTMTSGSYRLVVTGAGDKTDLRLDTSGVTLGSKKNVSLVLTQGKGGVLVHALQLVQQGALTVLANTQARVRVVCSVAGGATVTATLADVSLITGAASPRIGSYQLVTAGTQTLALTVAGTALATSAQTLVAGHDYTLLVWGDAAAPTVSLISEDNSLPTVSTKAKVRVLHALNGQTTALGLTVDYVSLVSGQAQGGLSAFGSVTAGSSIVVNLVNASTGATVATVDSDGTTLVARNLYTFYALGDSAAPTYIWQRESPVRSS